MVSASELLPGTGSAARNGETDAEAVSVPACLVVVAIVAATGWPGSIPAKKHTTVRRSTRQSPPGALTVLSLAASEALVVRHAGGY